MISYYLNLVLPLETHKKVQQHCKKEERTKKITLQEGTLELSKDGFNYYFQKVQPIRDPSKNINGIPNLIKKKTNALKDKINRTKRIKMRIPHHLNKLIKFYQAHRNLFFKITLPQATFELIEFGLIRSINNKEQQEKKGEKEVEKKYI